MLQITVLNSSMPSTKVLQNKIDCQHCSLFRLCIPRNINKPDLQVLERIIIRHTPANRGKHWFTNGDNFKSIFAVRSGCVKTYRTTRGGAEQICGFHMPGELFGLEAIHQNAHTCSAKALQMSSICEIPFIKLDQLCGTIPYLQSELTKLLSKEIVNQQWLITLLGKKSAEERIAAFLCNLSSRLEHRGYSANNFNLTMSRSDMGNYLGLAIETVSRILTRFQNNSLLTINGKHVQLRRPVDLCQIAGIDYQ